MRRIRAILFDFDGTILNSSIRGDSASRRFFEVAARLGLAVDGERKRKTEEMWGKYGPKAIVATCWPEQDFEAFIREWCRLDMHPALVPPLIHGAKETLRFLKCAKFFLGILTDRDAMSMRHIATEYDIAPFFEGIWTRDDLPEGGKSNPLSAEKAIEEIAHRGIKRSEILLVGDSKTDFECASAARLQFVGVLSGFAAESDFLSLGLPENRIIPSLAALPDWLKNS